MTKEGNYNSLKNVLVNLKQKVTQIIKNKMERSEPRIFNNRQPRFLRTATGVRTKNVYDTITNMTDASLIDYKIKLQTQINDLKAVDICSFFILTKYSWSEQ